MSKFIKGYNLVKMHLRVVAYIQNVVLVMANNYVKFDEENFDEMVWPCLCFSILKGRYFNQSTLQCYVLWLECSPCYGEHFMKLNEICLHFVKFMAEIC